jgi:hypothetical protein
MKTLIKIAIGISISVILLFIGLRYYSITIRLPGSIYILFGGPDAFYFILLLALFLIMLWFGFLVYFVSTILAYKRNKINKQSILILNLFTGWSFIGWVIALIWAVHTDLIDLKEK